MNEEGTKTRNVVIFDYMELKVHLDALQETLGFICVIWSHLANRTTMFVLGSR